MGGSESRFLISSALMKDEERYLHAPHDKKYGGSVVLAREGRRDRYEKVVLKRDRKSLNIRFDNYPQPYVGCSSDGTVEMMRYDKVKCRWRLMILGDRKQDDQGWEAPGEDANLGWDDRRGREMLVVFYNTTSKQLLCMDRDKGIHTVNFPARGQRDTPEWKASVLTAVTHVTTVDHNLSAVEVAAAVLAPAAAVCATAAAVAMIIFAPGAIPAVIATWPMISGILGGIGGAAGYVGWINNQNKSPEGEAVQQLVANVNRILESEQLE